MQVDRVKAALLSQHEDVGMQQKTALFTTVVVRALRLTKQTPTLDCVA
jgi:hypothetical protein